MACLGGRKPAVYFDQPFSLPLRFVVQHPVEATNGCILKALSQLGSRKATEIQVFDADGVVIFDNLGADFMQEVTLYSG